jgi:hypothetical protein
MTETFNFPHHTIRMSYPSVGGKMKMGSSYEFRSAPPGPPERLYTLTFSNMRVILNNDGTVDSTTDPTNNIFALRAFYAVHLEHEPFNYANPIDGMMLVRFNQPFELPEAIASRSGHGRIPPFSIQLMEMP